MLGIQVPRRTLYEWTVRTLTNDCELAVMVFSVRGHWSEANDGWCVVSRKPLRVEQLAREAESDLDEVLVTLWDAGVDYVEGSSSTIRGRDVAQARRSLGLTDAREEGTVDYWLRVSGLTRPELRERREEVSVSLPD